MKNDILNNKSFRFWLIVVVIAVIVIALVINTAREKAAENQADGSNWEPSVSADGRYVAFASLAGNLVPDDTNQVKDIFIKDTVSGETRRVSTNSNGSEADGDSIQPSISADGRYVAFSSIASNLVPGDDPVCSNSETAWNCSDVYVKDMQSGEIVIASISSDGQRGDWDSSEPSISADGSLVAFSSYASNLVEDDQDACGTEAAPTNCADIFVHEWRTRLTSRISITADDENADGDSTQPSLSSDGNLLAFTSMASNLDENDDNNVSDVFLYRLVDGDLSRISVASGGADANDASFEPSISADGRFVAFTSQASNLVPGDTALCKTGGIEKNCSDVFVKELGQRSLVLVSRTADGSLVNGASKTPSISGDGLTVAYNSQASNLVAGDTVLCTETIGNGNCTDIFVTDVKSGDTRLISKNKEGKNADWNSEEPSISSDGKSVAFISFAANLVKGDTDVCTDETEKYWNCQDVFLFNLDKDEVARVSTGSDD